MHDFTSVEQLFDKQRAQLANPEKPSLWQSFKANFRKQNKTKKSLKKLLPDQQVHGAKKNKRFVPKTWQKTFLLFCLAFVLIFSILLSYTYFRLQRMMQLGNATQARVMEISDLVKTQNLLALPDKVITLQHNVSALKSEYQALKIYQYLPIMHTYYADGQLVFTLADQGLALAEQIVTVLMPYADLLGFAGEGSFEGGTTQDRIVLILETLEEIQPTLDEIETKLQEIADLSLKIDASRYPEQVRGQKIRQTIINFQDQLSQAVLTYSDYKPILNQLAKIAGAKEAQKYLILFQNDNELRPTGGFLTAYSIIQIEQGTVIPEKSGDIYDLDLKFRQKIPIPEKLGRYLKTERYWNLRDMNIYPDFKKSMDTFYEYYQTIAGEPADIDGIIAVDTQVLTTLLQVIGPVQVPGYGTFSAEIDKRCDCPQVVYALSEIITRPTNYIREDRKGVLGPLMSTILSKTYELDKVKFPELITVATNSLKGRHLQLYFIDESSQLAAEKIHATGTLYQLAKQNNNQQFGHNQDFLAIINANLAGAKSNLFIDYDVKLSVTAPENDYIDNTLEITYRNGAPADNCNLEAGLLCLNATLNDWLRLYVPPNTELLDIQGLEEEANIYDEEGYTVIDGYFKLEPLGLARIRMTYRVPYQDQENYNLQLWKQGGISPVPVLIEVTGGEEELLMDQDLNYSTIF